MPICSFARRISQCNEGRYSQPWQFCVFTALGELGGWGLMNVGVIGLGYVGLPLCVAATRAGHLVIGYDISADVVTGLSRGRSHVGDVPREDLAEALHQGFQPTVDIEDLRNVEVIVICVPTPLSEDGGPDTSAIEQSGRAIAQILTEDKTVILESTTYPGTTQDLLVPILESTGLRVGQDFYCAFSPERVDPGNSEFSISNTPKIVGGITPLCANRAVDFYQTFVERVVRAKGTKEAEFAKLLENTYRHVNIALVNELAKFCHLLKIDLWDAIDCASTKPFGFQSFYPGPGVGGHCIPIDPNYLSHHIKVTLGEPFRFVELAQEINDSMPRYVVSRATQILNENEKRMKGAKILLLGVTYKADVGDERESPARAIAQLLAESGAEVAYHDPFIDDWQIANTHVTRMTSIEDGMKKADLAILLQSHSAYASLEALPTLCLILDTRGKLQGADQYKL